ncbi:MAG TPA: fatty acid desaturase [Anaeromyxobacteraceae bacterium]|nr:fatty acid desaturase [Anaeromyxobacteraceae bacterium]
MRAFERRSAPKAAWQVIDSLGPYLAILALMVVTVRHAMPWWTTLALAVPASGFMVRLFILMHDCAHSSFLPSGRAERMLGRILGVVVFTPFAEWRHAHLVHHATSGNLDRRGSGDIWTMTVREYVGSSRTTRLRYRLARNPLLMLLFGPFIVFAVGQRIPPRAANRVRAWSVISTDVAIAAIIAVAALTIGLRAYLLVQLPVLFLGGVWGIWLFYVQHQFEPSYWARSAEWSPVDAALQGSSYYRLPKLLQWFSGNIGLHHVHHLRPRIPNYNLQRCLDATPQLQGTRPLTLAASVRCARLALWDEQTCDFVSFRAVARARPLRRGGA